ncbi:MAG TPA: NBR1-Ig-like domain-containing protein [Anaerolineales bacterium]|nr:NBR1-Ig-like domain-containing protein [Anaerolineales bacterium]HNB35765.1 NBR1-Ig-like domain-containing protein [Anaerolineales bacterium]
MKHKLITCFIFAILLSACGQAAAESTESANGYSPEINTQVAQVLTSAVTPTPETLPTLTAKTTPTAPPTPAQTLLPTQTLPAQPKTYATLQPYLTNVTGYSSCDNSNYLSDITINQYVAPGETAKITVDLISPDTEGTYTGYWILTNRENQVFGETIYVTITVSKDETEEEPE